jgi:hypothetical protein
MRKTASVGLVVRLYRPRRSGRASSNRPQNARDHEPFDVRGLPHGLESSRSRFSRWRLVGGGIGFAAR